MKELLAKAAQQAVFRVDSWLNVLTGLGDKFRDKLMGAKFTYAEHLDKITLEELYAGDAMAAKIVDVLPEDMCREWIEYHQSDDAETAKAVELQLRKIKAQEAFEWALKLSRIYGGSCVVLGIDDGRDFIEPLDLKNIRSLSFLNVLDRWQIYPDYTALYRDPREPKYGLPELYYFVPVQHSTAVMTRIHESRLLRFDGVRLTDRQMLKNLGWGDPILNRLYGAIRNYHSVHDSAATIVSDFAQGVYKLKGLADLFGQGGDGADQAIMARLMQMDRGRSIVRGLVLDEDESFSKLSTPVAGLKDLISAAERRLTAETSMTHNRLLGESPGASLGEGGAAQDRQWYDHVASKQNTLLREPLERLILLTLLSKEGPTAGKLPAEWSIEFKSLWQQDEKEAADTRLAIAQADHLWVQDGVLTTEEVATSHFAGDGFSPDIVLDVEARMLLTDNPPEPTATVA